MARPKKANKVNVIIQKVCGMLRELKREVKALGKSNAKPAAKRKRKPRVPKVK